MREQLKKEAQDYIEDSKHEWYAPSKGVYCGMVDLIARQDAYIDELEKEILDINNQRYD